jgi:protein ImuB
MFAVIFIPHFSLQAALRHEPELWAKPVALIDPERTSPAVHDVTDPARASCVIEGLTPTQAMARCGGVLIRHRSPTQESAATEAILQCAFAFSPRIESTALGVCTLDLHGLATLSGADPTVVAAWAGQLRSTLAGQNLRACIGVGATPGLARHAARWTTGIEIVGDAKAFVAALPVAAIEPSSDAARLLQAWGIRTVGELLALGQEALADRIGLEALALFAAASTTAMRPLVTVQPAERFDDSFEFEHEIETMEPLLFILRRFVDQLSRRLELAGLVAEQMRLRLRLESGDVVERLLRIPEPTRQPDILFRMLHTHLETLRTDSAIRRVSLGLDPGRPVQKQLGLFDVVLRNPNQFHETLARLAALVGADRVGTPVLEDTHQPDAFRLLPPDFENAPAAAINRSSIIGRAPALRRLRPAAKASVVIESNPKNETVEAPSSTPISIRCTVADSHLNVAIGPWRASGNWWEPDGWQREEWDVASRNGNVMRLVRRPDGWFVEAVLD